MRYFFRALLSAAVIAGAPLKAEEPGTPLMVPVGGSIGVPVGANPPPGVYYFNRSEALRYNVYNGTTKTPIELSGFASAQQLHWVPGNEILGGTYRFMLSIPLVSLEQSAFGNTTSQRGIGDITISPLNLSWMLQPGIFVSTGLSLKLPTGSFDIAPGSVNLGNNATSVALDFGYSYLRDGWNLSAHANYIMNGENPDTNYTSGNVLLVNWTAMKDLGGYSIGPVGYFRKQVTGDKNNGAFYGGTTSGRSEQHGIGLGLSKRFGPMEVNVNYVHDFHVKNVAGGDKLMVNFSMPLGGRP